MTPTILTADINHDGKIDIITVNSGAGIITVLLGDGAGNFTPVPGSPIAAQNVNAVAQGDLNGDGNIDLIGSSLVGTIVFLGDGKGGFTPGAGIQPSTFHDGGSLLSVADFTGDGKLDLIVWHSSTGDFFKGDGNGGFTNAGIAGFTANTQFAIGNVSVADFDGDGKLDLAATPAENIGHQLVVSQGLGNGLFGPYFADLVATISASASVVGDFNNDGKPDILTFSAQSAITWFWTGGTPTTLNAFNSVSSASLVNPTYVVTGDFDGDGKLDWAAINQYNAGSGVYVYLGDGTGKFVEAPGSPYNVQGTLLSLATGDFNGDGRTDLAVHTNNSVVILLNTLTTGPLIKQGGIVPVYSTSNTVQPGSWISIYGVQLADTTTVWNSDFPQSHGGVTVTIDGKPGYLWYVSPTQINLQAPDDTPGSTVNVVVTNSHGSTTSTVALATQSPSFSLLDSTHVAGIILTPDGNGAYQNGNYDIVGPTGAFPYKTRPVKPGEVMELFGVGFGPTNPPVPAGAVPAQPAPTADTVPMTIGGTQALVSFSGITAAGLYQFNVTVPAVPSGDQRLVASVNGAQAAATLTIQ